MDSRKRRRFPEIGVTRHAGIPFLKGYNFSTNQRPGQSTQIMISKSLARQFFPGDDPIGKHITTYYQTDSEIVGIVGDANHVLSDSCGVRYQLELGHA